MSDQDTNRLLQTMLTNSRESDQTPQEPTDSQELTAPENAQTFTPSADSAEPIHTDAPKSTGAEAFFLEYFNVDRVFRGIDRADYIFLYYIQLCKDQNPDRELVYLSDLSAAMKLDVTEISKAIERLQDRGYVIWKTDASQGKTYVLFTSKTVEMMADEKKRIMNCYQAIVQEIGMGELGATVMTLRKIMDIIKRTNAGNE